MRKETEKRKIMQVFCTLLCIGVMTGCGGNSTADTQTAVSASESSTDTETETTELSAADDVEKETEPAESKDTEESETSDSSSSSSSVSASAELYENFLAGNAEMDISRADLWDDASDYYTPQLKEDETYTMEEFLTGFFADQSGYNDGDYAVDQLYYAYTDCQQDGTEELVLQFTSYMYNDEYSNIMVIKDISGQLVLCAWLSDGYRSYNYINSYGVLAQGGSGGADIWYDSYYGIDENGDKYVIYESEICGPYDLYMGSEMNPGEEASELGAEDICITRYSFEAYPYDDYEEEHYLSFLKGNYYTYWKGSAEDEDQSAELYDANSSYAVFMDMVTDNWHTPDEMQTILADNLAQKGLTSEMLENSELSWTEWKGNAVPFGSENADEDNE